MLWSAEMSRLLNGDASARRDPVPTGQPEPSCSHYERGASSTSFGVRLALPSALPLMRKLVERYETLHGVDSPLIAEALTLLIETLFSEQRSIKLDDAKNARKQFLRIEKEIARSTERVSR